MITNNNLPNEYGDSKGITLSFTTLSPYRPIPLTSDYDKGYFVRWFAKHVSSGKIIEISPDDSGTASSMLYVVKSLNWKISGEMDRRVVGRVIESSGVIDSNRAEIARLKASGFDLSSYLTNPSEFWRGY